MWGGVGASVTTHRDTIGQGKTTGRVLVHLDTKCEKTIGSEIFYVAISRARHEARLYVDDRSKLALAIGRSRQKQYGLEATGAHFFRVLRPTLWMVPVKPASDFVKMPMVAIGKVSFRLSQPRQSQPRWKWQSRPGAGRTRPDEDGQCPSFLERGVREEWQC